LPKRKRARKTTEGSDSETFSSSSSISSSPLQSQPSTPPLQIVIQQGTGTSKYIPQPSQTSIYAPSQPSGTSLALSSISSSKMAQNPWNNLGVVTMPASLNPLPTHLEKWLPKFNLGVGIQNDEHINNFMLSANLKGVTEEDVVVRLFPYTLQGSAGPWYFSLPSGSITSWNIFQEQFLTKYADDRSVATLINDLSNLRTESREPIKEFNSCFNKLLNKIPTASKPNEKVGSEWYIAALPSNIAIFVERVAKTTLVENMKEAIAVEKCSIALEKKATLEDRKSKKVSFKDDSKKKMAKDPYDMEGLQNFLKTMTNEMIEIKKQVAETSTEKPFRNFKKPKSKHPNAISNIESDPEDKEEEDTVLSPEETEEEVTVECHGMWDFILPNSDT